MYVLFSPNEQSDFWPTEMFAFLSCASYPTGESFPLRGNCKANQLALVTGASSGIGFFLAKELAGRGYDLVVCSAGDRLSTAAQQLRSKSVEVLEVQADLATRGGVDHLWGRVRDLGRDLDLACINAGVGVGGLFSETALEADSTLLNSTVPEPCNLQST